MGVTILEKKMIIPTFAATKAFDKEFTRSLNRNRLFKCKNVPAFSANFSVYSQQLPNNNEPFLKYSQSICEPNSNANFFNLNWIL